MTFDMARHLANPLRPLDLQVFRSTDQWDLERAWRLGDNIPGYRYSASM